MKIIIKILQPYYHIFISGGRAHFNKIMFFFGVLILFGTIASGTIQLSKTTNHRAIIQSRNNDAGRAIGTAMISRWWNSNHFAAYGNVYFRLAHTVATFVPAQWLPNDYNEQEKTEAIHHFALLIVSYFSFILMVILSLWMVGVGWSWIPWLAALGVNTAGLSDVIVNYILIAHPDHLLMLSSLVASFLTLKWLKEGTLSNYTWMTFWWGLGFAIKRSLIMYTVGFLFLFVPPFKKEGLKRFFGFVGLMFLFYELVGFPQNFSLYKHISFMALESYNSLPATWDTARLYLGLLIDQSWGFMVPVLIGALFFRRVHNPVGVRVFTKMGIFFVLALIPLVSRYMVVSSYHHTFPYVGTLLVVFIAGLSFIPVYKMWWVRAIGLVCVCLLLVLIRPYSQKAWDKTLALELSCDPAISKVYALSKKLVDEGALIMIEPYVPRDQTRVDRARQQWSLSFEALEQADFTHLFLRSSYYKQYLNKGAHWLTDWELVDWNKSLEFYPHLWQKTEFKDRQGHLWKKIHQFDCDYEVWEKSKGH